MKKTVSLKGLAVFLFGKLPRPSQNLIKPPRPAPY